MLLMRLQIEACESFDHLCKLSMRKYLTGVVLGEEMAAMCLIK